MRDVIIVRSIICSTSVLFFFNGDKFKTYATFFSQPCNERGIACIIIRAVIYFRDERVFSVEIIRQPGENCLNNSSYCLIICELIA